MRSQQLNAAQSGHLNIKQHQIDIAVLLQNSKSFHTIAGFNNHLDTHAIPIDHMLKR
ncbi:hypothetical protein D3C86_2213430 [compost metagenome]